MPLFALAVLGALTLASAGSGRRCAHPRRWSRRAAGRGGRHRCRHRRDRGQFGLRLPPAIHPAAMMNSMHGICIGNCLAQAQHATLAAHVRGVLYVSGFLLLTNLVLVAWMVAMRRRPAERHRAQPATVRSATAPRTVRDRAQDRRLVLGAALVASAAIHAAVVPEHLTEWPAAGVFFILLTAAEIGVACLLLFRPTAARCSLPPRSRSARCCSGCLQHCWPALRTGSRHTPRAIGLPDIVGCALEIVALVAAVLAAPGRRAARHRPPSQCMPGRSPSSPSSPPPSSASPRPPRPGSTPTPAQQTNRR